MARPIKPVPVDTSCCAGYKEFTFYLEWGGPSDPPSVVELNSLASNYVHGVITATEYQYAIDITFPFTLVGKYIQLIPPHTEMMNTITYTTIDEVMNIEKTTPPTEPMQGVFTIKIWTA